jgi:hypothetical protein
VLLSTCCAHSPAWGTCSPSRCYPRSTCPVNHVNAATKAPTRACRSALLDHSTPTTPTCANQPTRRTIILAISTITIFVVLFRFYGDVPVEYYRNYGPGEAIAPATTNNDTPQPGYFKDQPEWDFSIPKYAQSMSGYARTPRNKDIVVLTASDGGGHNSAIPNVLERVLDDREKYCAKHGYTNLWLNTSRYDIKEAHRVSLHRTWRLNVQQLTINPHIDVVQDSCSFRSIPPLPQRRMGLAH